MLNHCSYFKSFQSFRDVSRIFKICKIIRDFSASKYPYARARAHARAHIYTYTHTHTCTHARALETQAYTPFMASIFTYPVYCSASLIVGLHLLFLNKMSDLTDSEKGYRKFSKRRINKYSYLLLIKKYIFQYNYVISLRYKAFGNCTASTIVIF